jgi:hypothetical protein
MPPEGVRRFRDNDMLENRRIKCGAALRPELRKNKEIERFHDSEKSGNALGKTDGRKT